jgi:hypothetical protein
MIMDPVLAAIIAEGIKGVFGIIIQFSQQQGLTVAQIETNFQAALEGVKSRDPSKIPS